MKTIYFFDAHLKPRWMRGKKLVHPTETAVLKYGISCIRQYDVNLWFYTKEGITIAFDAGHLNYPNAKNEFTKIGLKPEEMKHVFLTHVDVDHAGGVDVEGISLFPNAQIYLGEKEEAYLKREIHRFKRFGIKIKNCVKLAPGYRLLKADEVVEIADIKVETVFIPGHTYGHCGYLVDERIFISGDCLAINDEGGYSFFDFFTQDPDLNKASLKWLKERLEKKEILMFCTGHSGYHHDIEKCFRHFSESAPFSKERPFDESAPYDVFRET